ncbi:MAG: SGNH/GDSL hydrolase family protein, partial [Armatimonadota bacterium]|nr:SGNH/GDSL hydrolase family protein [Armatimonadota bacterium]
NFGLHDLRLMPNGQPQVALDEYERNLRSLVARLKQTGARLIWASTTPVPDGRLNPPRRNADVIAYNAVAKKVMEENGIPINDLYACALPRLAELQRPANVHFTPEGSEKLADEVTKSILLALKPGI